MLDLIIRLVSKYAASHMYDIYAFLSGTIAYVLVMSLKVFAGKKINRVVILFSTIILGALIFIAASNISPQVYVDAHAGKGVGSILYAGGIAFAEYVAVDLITNKFWNVFVIAAVFAAALYVNIYFCEMIGTHYKACFGLKIGVALCCAWGLIRLVLAYSTDKEK